MDVREKLVWLVKNALAAYGKKTNEVLEPCEFIADFMMANGVTVQDVPDIHVGKWISVKDRLPERTLPPKDVLVYHDLGCGMFIDRAWYSYDKKRWCSVLGMKLKVTYWMPLSDLPQPPKGETIYCKDCENLMFSDCYGECTNGHKGIVSPNDTCEHAKKRKPPKGE